MKRYTATFFRYNPQLSNGGYETTRTIEARTERSAWKKAQEICKKTIYGSMSLIDVKLAEQA